MPSYDIKYDIKKAYPALYAPKPGGFHVVDVPEIAFLMVDGHGDPNVSPAYADAVTALYTLSYTVRAIAKAELGRVHTVGPLEGLWSADDPSVFRTREKSAWDWTMMIMVPDRVDERHFEAARERAGHKLGDALSDLRLGSLAEGHCLQALHIGSYDDEAPLLAQLHEQIMPASGYLFAGPHHEIYLSDPRKTEASRLRTILRQPVRPAD